MNIIPYDSKYEKSWLYTKALSHLFSPFFDDMSRVKEEMNTEVYEDQLDLIAVEGEQVLGLLCISIYKPEYSRSYAYYPCEKVAYFENLAVHPDYQNQGIASKLWEVADAWLKEQEVQALAIFTRDGDAANHLYQKWGGQLVAEDYLVVGTPKDQEGFTFEVLREEKRLKFSRDGKEIPYYQREGTYIVSQKENLELFDIDAVCHEKTYIKVYEAPNY
ncbi:ribosomal protein S18 acetylase RimI-like enzyme [Streptococcus rupicaprae]|uniref:Ribosomal protein S18 acetylase RimI-like enzyme n=1 Tax=Streptococcus rupicaprae TaxID=759619 RepID=A0ABV2FJ61_9STRE